LVALWLVLGSAAALAQSTLLWFIIAGVFVIALALRTTTLWRDWARAAEELGQAQGEARVRASGSETELARVHDAETRLAQLNHAIPETLERAQSQRDAIPREPGSPDEWRAAQDATRERLMNARAVLGELTRQNTLPDAASVETERVRSEHAAQKVERLVTAWQPRLQARADALSVTLDTGTLQQAWYAAHAQIEQLQHRTNEAARFNQEIARREQQTQSLWARAREAYENARAVKLAFPLDGRPSSPPIEAAQRTFSEQGDDWRGEAQGAGVPAWDVSLTVEDYNGFGKNLRAEYDALGGEAVVKHARDLEGELGRRQGERAARARNAGLLVARTQEILAELGSAGALTESPALSELEQLDGKLQSLDLAAGAGEARGDEVTLRARHRELVGRVHSLRDRQMQLERDLGLAGTTLDLAACRAEWEAQVRESLVRERGVEIVSLARKRIVQKVLPATMDYMRRILPTLTRDRYHDAQLDPETYKIQVWDERAGAAAGASGGGAFKEKNIFSGGTKDQFSLALRLAFALATLPQERGSAPSFIFLDEPLGSFDDERADALIYLLTEGEIARAFDQIFLISHVHVNERLFTHRVVLENGRVVETDLA
jgi:DNA repair exonuclease SbcCD ATPase subunit